MSLEVPQAKAELNEADRNAAIQAWVQHLARHGTASLVRIEDLVEDTPDGFIEPVETPAGLIGDAAVVTMRAGTIKTDTPHYHLDEHEGHIATKGMAMLSLGAEIKTLAPGNEPVIVSPEVSHFTIPFSGQDYEEVAVSFPGYNPDNQKSFDLADAPGDFNAALYARAHAQL